MGLTSLRGITWDHPRAVAPLLAASEAFSAERPDVVLRWTARPLSEFESYPVDLLAERYDLIALDHPFIGTAVAKDALLPLDRHLSTEVLAERATASLGPSFRSYTWLGHQWALPIDGAAQVSASRADLLAKAGAAPPKTWSEVVAFGRDLSGRMILALNPIHAFCTWVTMGAAITGEGFWRAGRGWDRDGGGEALALLRDVAQVSAPESLTLDPIGVLDQMVREERWLYAPAIFGYVTYARRDLAAHPLRFGDLPVVNGRRRSTLGGVGLAVSARSRHPSAALGFAQAVTGPCYQRGLYVRHGGQPAHRQAWLDDAANTACENFFRGTLATLETAFVRPRYAGFPAIQKRTATAIHAFLTGGGSVGSTMQEVCAIERQARVGRRKEE